MRISDWSSDVCSSDLLRSLVKAKAKVLEAWAAAGKIEPVDPVHLFSVIWAATQHYADFEVQVGALLGRRQLSAKDYDEAAESIVRMVLGTEERRDGKECGSRCR